MPPAPALSEHDESVLEERCDDLRDRHPGVIRILESHDVEKSKEGLAHAW